MAQPRLPTCADRALSFGRQLCSWLLLLELGEHLAELFFEPGMQHRVGRRDDAFGAQVARGWAKQGEQFGRACAFVLMWLQGRMTFRLPRGPRLRDRLIRPAFILIQLHDPGGFRLLARELDQSFFSGVCGPYAATRPPLLT